MSERLSRITPEMDEEEALGLILDALIDRAESDVAEAIRLCAIPHWFNGETLAWLRGEGRETSGRTREILANLAKLTFVGLYRDLGYAYHENVRNLLLRRWRKENAERFQELSGMAAAYYADKLQVGELSEEQHAEWEREEMYHLLVADEGRGIDLFISLLNRASQFYQLSTFDLLLGLAREQAADLSASNRPWLRFFEGKLALLSGDWEGALKIWEALEGEREQVSKDLEKTLAAHLSFLYKDKGKWDKAVECLQRSLEILKQTDDKRGMADTFNNLGFLYKDKNQWREADRCFKRSLKILKKASDKRGIAITFNNLGLLYKDKGKWEKANGYFRRGLKVLEKAGDERGMATILNSLGFLYKDREEWEKADKYFQRSLEIMGKVGDEHGMADTFNYLGFLYTDKGEWEKADGYLQRSLEILKRVGDERGMVDIFNNLGSLYRCKEEWEKADGYFQRSLEILEKIGDERGVAGIYNNLGLLYRARKEWEEADRYLQRSLKILEEAGDEMNAATTMYNIALLYEDMAVELREKVVKICERVGHPNLTIRRSRETLEKIKKKAR
ncbi:MAG: tetratricopeptide repeat protein [Chloroflexota bacterium]|nr:tetratricopeptide repeat protein [Chloroflexota bacterium]